MVNIIVDPNDINPPLVDPPQFNQFMSDDNMIKDIQSNALGRLFYNTNLERIDK